MKTYHHQQQNGELTSAPCCFGMQIWPAYQQMFCLARLFSIRTEVKSEKDEQDSQRLCKMGCIRHKKLAAVISICVNNICLLWKVMQNNHSQTTCHLLVISCEVLVPGPHTKLWDTHLAMMVLIFSIRIYEMFNWAKLLIAYNIVCIILVDFYLPKWKFSEGYKNSQPHGWDMKTWLDFLCSFIWYCMNSAGSSWPWQLGLNLEPNRKKKAGTKSKSPD